MRGLWLLTLSLCGLAQAAGFALPPPPAPPQPLLLPEFAQAALANGMQLVVIERRGLPLVTAMLSVQAGSLLDPPGKSGLAELSFGVLGKGARRGNAKADASALAYATNRLGSELDISTGPQASRLTMTVLTQHLDGSLGLLADVLRAPTLPELEIISSRLQMQQAVKLEAADPAALAPKLAWRLHWGDAPPGRLSTEQSLARIRREDVQAFCRQQLRPDQTTLILAGDLDLAQGKLLAERYFGGWRRPNAATKQTRPETLLGPQGLGARSLLVDLPGSGQSAVLLLAPYPARLPGSAGRAELRSGALATAILGSGYSSRINQQVRIKRGLSYGAYSSAESLPGGGLLLLSSQTKHVNAAEVADLLRGELLRLSTEPVPADELLARRTGLIGDFARQTETTLSLASLAAEQIEHGGALTELANFENEMKAVSAEQVQAFAQRFWPQSAVGIVVVGQLGGSDAALPQPLAPAWVIPAAELDLDAPTLRRPAAAAPRLK
ncbi:MAG: insulinase family protein [Paucibacter sp.]|nr:insulinase family protein [Roseateles sp.]